MEWLLHKLVVGGHRSLVAQQFEAEQPNSFSHFSLIFTHGSSRLVSLSPFIHGCRLSSANACALPL